MLSRIEVYATGDMAIADGIDVGVQLGPFLGLRAGDASALFPHIQTMKARAASGVSAWPFIGSRNLRYLDEYLSSLAFGEPGKTRVYSFR